MVDSLRVVKEQSGIEGNEVADKLAKEAAKDVNEQNIVYDWIPTVATKIKMKGLKVANTMGQY